MQRIAGAKMSKCEAYHQAEAAALACHLTRKLLLMKESVITRISNAHHIRDGRRGLSHCGAFQRFRPFHHDAHLRVKKAFTSLPLILNLPPKILGWTKIIQQQYEASTEGSQDAISERG